MARIFLSHSSRDNRQAIALKAWLVAQDPALADEIFLDLDPDTGIAPGVRWKDALVRATSRCEAVICLLSEHWDSSPECRTELRTAENLNKRIFAARLEPFVSRESTREWQQFDLFPAGPATAVPVTGGPPVEFATEGLRRLWRGLREAGIGAEYFEWPPTGDPGRAPYRGWAPFDAVDAAVYFGRDAQIVRGLDMLRGMRTSRVENLFVILGPSGTGKSSFLRAGLLPRLRRDDRHFLVLDIVRPERAAVTGPVGLAASLYAVRRRLGLTQPTLGAIKAACASDLTRVATWLREAQDAATAGTPDSSDTVPPTIVLPVDQAEELFGSEAGREAGLFQSILAHLVDDGLDIIAALTIRADRYEPLQTSPALAAVKSVVFDELRPLQPARFAEVVRGPAERATAAGSPLTVREDLVERLLADCADSANPLPLLSLTLWRLYLDYAAAGELTSADYTTMGGMAHVVESEIDSILAQDDSERQQQLAHLRAAFVPWLATIASDNDQPLRRIARLTDLPAASRPLIAAFVDHRLLVQDERGGETTIEVALESLLSEWPALAQWLREEAADLRTADGLDRAATEWESSGRDDAWLIEGTRLSEAEKVAATPGFADRLACAREYLAASRQRQDAEIAAEQQRREKELNDARAYADGLRRRTHILRAVLALTVIAALVAGFFAVRTTLAQNEADRRLHEATALRLVSEGQAMLAGIRPGGDTRAIQQILAARRIGSHADDGAVLDALSTTSAEMKILGTPAHDAVTAFTVSPDGRHAASASRATVQLRDSVTGQTTGPPLTTNNKSAVNGLAYSADGRRLAAADNDGTVQIWDIQSGSQIAGPFKTGNGAVVAVAFSPDGRHLAASVFPGAIQIWDVVAGQQLRTMRLTDMAWRIAFLPEGNRIVTTTNSGLRLWDTESGTTVAQTPDQEDKTALAVAVAPAGGLIASSGYDNLVRFWDATTLQPAGAALSGHDDAVNAIGFSPDGRNVVSGSSNGTIRLWDVASRQPTSTPMTGHHGSVKGVGFTADGHGVLSGGDETIRVWNADTAATIGTVIAAGDTSVMSVHYSADGTRLVSAGARNDPSSSLPGVIRIWDAATGALVSSIRRDDALPVNAVFSHDGTRIITLETAYKRPTDRIAVAFVDLIPVYTIATFDAKTGAPVAEREIGAQKTVGASVLSPDGTRLATVGGVVPANLLTDGFQAYDLTSPSFGLDLSVMLWDPRTGNQIGTPIDEHSIVNAVAFSPDGRHLITNGGLGKIKVWDADTHHQVGEPISDTNTPQFLTYSPDGRRIASASPESIRLFDADSRKLISDSIADPKGAIEAISFSADGRYVIAGSGKSVRIWDATSGLPVGRPMVGPADTIRSLAVSPDDRRLATVGSSFSADGHANIHLWPGPAAWPDRLCDKLTANMSHKEWNEWVSPDIPYRKACDSLPVASDAGT
ncbi:TIR domain-containing protein [Nocardia sp. NPDC004151]|uniref:nSTAND1 domain-containing NTPase n=1 Tax=Nocardia sp. NPDC004151 TaxID=3364304 RepID=UPI0036B9BF5E